MASKWRIFYPPPPFKKKKKVTITHNLRTFFNFRYWNVDVRLVYVSQNGDLPGTGLREVRETPRRSFILQREFHSVFKFIAIHIFYIQASKKNSKYKDFNMHTGIYFICYGPSLPASDFCLRAIFGRKFFFKLRSCRFYFHLLLINNLVNSFINVLFKYLFITI